MTQRQPHILHLHSSFSLGGKAFTDKDALNGFQELLEKVICGSKTSTTSTTEFCCCQEYVEKAGD